MEHIYEYCNEPKGPVLRGEVLALKKGSDSLSKFPGWVNSTDETCLFTYLQIWLFYYESLTLSQNYPTTKRHFLLHNSSSSLVWTAVVLRCGKQMEKLPHHHFSWIVSFQKQRYHIYARCFLWRQNNPEVNCSPNRIPRGGVSRGNVMQWSHLT